MKRIALAALCVFIGSSLGLAAQEKTKTDEKTETKSETRRELIPLRVQVVISEYDGEKKLSSLPYTLLINSENPRGQKASIRMGLRVPVATSVSQFQYIDVGSNLDGWAGRMDDGRFVLHLSLERSSTYSPGGGGPASFGGKEIDAAKPVVQTFKAELDLLLRDGQTIQSTLATDPVSGRVSKVDVTLNVLK